MSKKPKLSSYQKLKKERDELLADMRRILGYSGFWEKSQAEQKHMMRIETQNAMMLGTREPGNFRRFKTKGGINVTMRPLGK